MPIRWLERPIPGGCSGLMPAYRSAWFNWDQTIRQEDGEEKTFTILGEWDSDEELNIISNKTTMATSLLGKKVGEPAVIPTSEGKVKADVIAIAELSERIKAWIATTPEPIAKNN